jgi:ABC-type multidrug transport system ATPase subunit
VSTATAPGVALRLAGDGISHRYGARLALHPVSFEIASPGVVAITGENGSGKSTLLRILIGLMRPTAGTSVLDMGGAFVAPRSRRLVTGLSTPELSFYEEFSAAENLLFAAETRGVPDPHGAVRDALSAVELTPRAGDRVGAFSSGMKQRLRLAFAVLHRPALLLLDEPGSHLDEAGRDVVARLVHSHARQGLVLIATNDPEEMTLAQRRIELRGRGLGSPS